MQRTWFKIVGSTIAIFFAYPVFATEPQAAPKKLKSVPRTEWNFSGGVFFETDGSIANKTCFRISGRMTAAGFFNNLIRIDSNNGTEFQRDSKVVTEYPEKVALFFVIRDEPCSKELNDAGNFELLTREKMSTLRLSLYWKRGVALRPVEGFKPFYETVEPIKPFSTENAAELPKRFLWSYGLEVPSTGVPLTDGLVLIVHTRDGKIAARVAARL